MKSRPVLDNISKPADLQALTHQELATLAQEIREELQDVVFANGGHLASNLGVVELTIALLRVFDLPTDKIVWDTGHQGYVYKLLTGRRELFQSLRQDDGCCGFLHREENPYDFFGAGHAGTAISAAAGMAAERDQRNGSERVMAVIGDGALASGIALEGLNNIIEATQDFILVLNDNKMSIAPNVGALSRNLNRIISTHSYNRFKGMAHRAIERIPAFGKPLLSSIHQVEEAAKNMLVPGALFEELGLRYIGPLDGHDIPTLLETLGNLKDLRQPLLLHVLTEKGHGNPDAVQSPEAYHGVSKPACAPAKAAEETGEPTTAAALTFSEAAGRYLEELMQADKRTVAITAGMCKGTGLGNIRSGFSKRFFDVGIAEEHAVVFAAGLAASGMRPVVAVYATFMQRAMDYVFHDVCLQNLPVVFMCDRAGIVADGPTHHGIHDLSFWRSVPNLAVLQPCDQAELKLMLDAAVAQGMPAVIRYAKSEAGNLTVQTDGLEWGRGVVVREGRDLAIWCLGRELERGQEVAELLAEKGIQACLVNPRFVEPFDRELLCRLAADMPLVTIEDHVGYGGLASVVRDTMVEEQLSAPLMSLAWPNEPIPWGTVEGIRAKYGMTSATMADRIMEWHQNLPQ
ncbi:MAG: 1-deoxy-D-xylulose-5-phosphate synthase [Lentisphaeria bacterium]